MGLNIVKNKSNMYQFIDATWNTIKGACPHDCSYCYMKRWGKLNPARFDEKELKTNLGSGNFIFVGSSCDMFAEGIPRDWVIKTLQKTHEVESINSFLFQTKNPSRINDNYLPMSSIVCTTIETNRWYSEIMRNSPHPLLRRNGMSDIDFPRYLTIEPIMDFDLEKFVYMIDDIYPDQVNIGADSGGHSLPEPPKEKVVELIHALEEFTTVHQKSNLKRLLR